MPNRWNCPFLGLGFFLTHPRFWGWALLGVLISGAATLAVTGKVIAATYPHPFSFWPFLQSLGWGLFSFLLLVIVLFPIVFNACFTSALMREARRAEEGSFWNSFASSFWVFFRTLRWRILWPILLLLCLFFIPLLVFPLSLLAVNHLAILESADLVLSIYGYTGAERVSWLQSRGSDCLAAALSGSLLLFLLSFLIIGWIFWIPAIYCGVFVWLRSEIPSKK